MTPADRPAQSIPCFINVRDRVSDLKLLVDWLERAGMQDIRLLDNASTYPPCLEFLESQGERVIRLPNLGHRALTESGLEPRTPYILSDPDLVPLGPPEGIDYLWELGARYSDRYKVGFGLMLEGATMPMAVYRHEQQMWNPAAQLEPNVYAAPIDTTFAIWYPDRAQHGFFHCIRTGPPHVMRHSSYFTDYSRPETFSEEDRYYLEHAEGNASGWKYDIARLDEISR